MGQGQRAARGGKKKLILAVLVQHSPYRELLRCDECTDEEKAQRGCEAEVDDVGIRPTCVCKAQKGCDTCGGSGTMTLRRCPRKLAGTASVRLLLPLFYLWRGTDGAVWPDGQPAYDQPTMLMETFGILSSVTNERETVEMQQRMSNARTNHGSTRS